MCRFSASRSVAVFAFDPVLLIVWFTTTSAPTSASAVSGSITSLRTWAVSGARFSRFPVPLFSPYTPDSVPVLNAMAYAFEEGFVRTRDGTIHPLSNLRDL